MYEYWHLNIDIWEMENVSTSQERFNSGSAVPLAMTSIVRRECWSILVFNENTIPPELWQLISRERHAKERCKRERAASCRSECIGASHSFSHNFTVGSFVISRPILYLSNCSAIEKRCGGERQGTADENSRIKHRYI